MLYPILFHEFGNFDTIEWLSLVRFNYSWNAVSSENSIELGDSCLCRCRVNYVNFQKFGISIYRN